MAKRDTDKSTQQHQQQQSVKVIDEITTGSTADPLLETPSSDTASQLSKETTSDRKKKGWTKTLKKATNSIIYMAMPPTSADHAPMVVAQTPMSPDRLIPTLHSPLLSSGEPFVATALTDTATIGPLESISITSASSTLSVTSSSAASSASFKPRVTQEPHLGHPSVISSTQSTISHSKQRSASIASSSTSSTSKARRSIKGKEKATSAVTDLTDGQIHTGLATKDAGNIEVKGRSFSSTSLLPPSPSRPTLQDSNNLTVNVLPTASNTLLLENSHQESLSQSPSSPIKVTRKSMEDIFTDKDGDRSSKDSKAANKPDRPHSATANSDEAQQSRPAEQIQNKNAASGFESPPMLSSNTSRLNIELDVNLTQTSNADQIGAPEADVISTQSSVKPAARTRQDIVVEGFEETVADLGSYQDSEGPQSTQKAIIAASLPGSFPGASPKSFVPVNKVAQSIRDESMAVSSSPGALPGAFPGAFPGTFPVHTVSALSGPLPVELLVQQPSKPLPDRPHGEALVNTPTKPTIGVPLIKPGVDSPESPIDPPVVLPEVSNEGPKIEAVKHTKPSDQTVMSVNAALGSPALPTSTSLSHTTSKSLKQQTTRNAPWLWHQDGIHHQRLESHQILTKEQVFEQFHLDLEQDGPNGFFLFKLVRRYKKQDPSMIAISSTLLDTELSASPASLSPTNATPTSILESLEAVSVSQKLKRQLLLQKRKKQRKVPSSLDSEEDENFEALLTMSNNNTSLQNLNSSLLEVIDAVDCLKGDREEWASLLNNQPHKFSEPAPSSMFSYPDSENEYTSKDKDAMDVETLEKRRGVYATGRYDGMNLISKKKYKAAQRRSSMSTPSRKGSIPSASGNSTNGAHNGATDGPGYDKHGSEATDGPSPQFKKQAVSQLHIYSRNGLKFKFDVMEDNELHFVEASKKYTFMDPLAAERQPDLDVHGTDIISPLRPSTLPQPPIGRRTSSGTVATLVDTNRPPRRSDSSRSKSTLSSTRSTGGRRVFVTRLGRHTLLTYTEYKALAKSASSFTLGAKLLLQRSIAVATPSFYGSSGSNGHSKEPSSSGQANSYDTTTPVSPTKSIFGSSTNPTPTPGNSGNTDGSDYFSLKKKPRVISGFASKAVAAIKSPSSSSAPAVPSRTSRAIVTPYNPNDYKNKSLTVSTTIANTAAAEDSCSTGLSMPLYSPSAQKSTAVDIPQAPVRRGSSVLEHPPSSPSTPMGMGMASPQATPTFSPPSTPSTSSSNPYGSIRRAGNQAGLKFQHLFVTVHQRLQKLELDTGASFYGSSLVQWTVIEDPAELRWWRDKIGIKMISRLEGDELISSGTKTATATGHNKISMLPQFSSTISLRSSYVSADSTISDATSNSPSSSLSALSSFPQGYKSHVSVERLGYRFLRVSGHMGTLKITVSEQVEARAVALAVQAEIMRQKRMAQQKQGVVVEGDPLEQPWVEASVSPVVSDDDTFVSNEDESDRECCNGVPIQLQQHQSHNHYDGYEHDESTEKTRLRKDTSRDLFSRRKRHDRATGLLKNSKQVPEPLIERMTMIVGQAKVFKGDFYMKNIYKFNP
ncbi:hypothetical protein BX616_010999 [Lobosporangium transversale]|uniref:Uncharacterized protein n=1 Tax=Lobosporangium transversale TaxID=64571 RepID=A0A1Y2H235_9FUNG|nr:hypothetical protein BCR41DRAFT_289 [Lobosporangium transversale]KAF9909971.1 hypothetical protein BX616_010999 [Lobosporangium transversale]ORZ28606.1 hypothetical protein BCR41DRAFT_289 [Lobosporangium transversale]|eukprot:XP_021886279.1 hypothetical protein BCR41DRAFT_289 [Lobosporangium transversale]